MNNGIWESRVFLPVKHFQLWSIMVRFRHWIINSWKNWEPFIESNLMVVKYEVPRKSIAVPNRWVRVPRKGGTIVHINLIIKIWWRLYVSFHSTQHPTLPSWIFRIYFLRIPRRRAVNHHRCQSAEPFWCGLNASRTGWGARYHFHVEALAALRRQGRYSSSPLPASSTSMLYAIRVQSVPTPGSFAWRLFFSEIDTFLPLLFSRLID